MLEFVENVQFGTENAYIRVACAYEEHLKKKKNLKNNCNQDDFTTGSDSMISYASSCGACPTRCERQP